MKAFIFVALVATVAARGLDLDTLRLIKEKSLLNTRPVVDDLLLKEKLEKIVPDVLEKVNPIEEEKTHLLKGLPLRRTYDEVDRVYSFEELYNTELFQEYLRIPLFRQYIQYPSFQRYVASVYFQRFWQVPTFRTYFYNPVLFYKYIYPLVQLFHNEYNMPVKSIYGQEDIYNHQDMYEGLFDNYYRNRNVLPYVYNNRYGLPSTRYTGEYNPYTTGTHYKFLLDRIYKTLFANQPVYGDVTEVKTDVKLLPGDKKVVVEPITGERKIVVEEPKIVDVKVAQKVEKVLPIDSVFPEHREFTPEVTERDVLLYKVLLHKEIITPEIYDTLVRGHVELYTVLRKIYGHQIDFTQDKHVVVLKVLLKEHVITPEIYEAVIRGQVEFLTLIRQVLRNERFDKFDVPEYREFTPEVTERDVLLYKVLLHKQIITPEIYETLIRGHVELYTVLRQIYGHQIDFTQDKHVVVLKVLLKEHVITPEIYEAVIRGQVEFLTFLRQILKHERFDRFDVNDIVNEITRREHTDYEFPTTTYNYNRFDRFFGNDRYNNFFNKYYKYKNLYNTEYPTYNRENTYNRLPIRNVLGNIFA